MDTCRGLLRIYLANTLGWSEHAKNHINSQQAEVIMVTDMVTGKQTIRMRVADGRSEKERQAGMSARKQAAERERPTEPSQQPVSRHKPHWTQRGRARTSKVRTGTEQYH